MPRRARIHLAGVRLHIVQRGHNRDACFFVEDDYLHYLHWLGEALKATDCRLHAYVLMTNHVHLLLTPPDPREVPRVIISLGRCYVQYINRTYRRTGTLLDSRHKSSLVQEETYLLICQRYIELNPVRADIVDDPENYRWSSYQSNGLGEPNALLTPHPLYLALAPDHISRRAAYWEFFGYHLDAEALADIRLAIRQNQPLGNARFPDTIERMTGQRREAKPRGRPRKTMDRDEDLARQRALDL